MASIYIDNRRFEVDDRQNLLAVALSLGFNLPYFCYHPALGSVGACRQCAVKQFRDEKDTRGRLVMACMTPAKDGSRISIEDPEARAFRASVIEWLMENHPHDCPVCDEGGECHLQDMTLMTGHDYRRYRGLKRTYRNQYLGPFVNHEMNRCIQCYRCVRYYRDYADGRDFDAYAIRNNVYFGRQADGVLENEFSGNLVEICPTGVFTDATLKHHYTRKWDLETSPSICVNCGVGCNTISGARYGTLRRIRSRYNGEVNGYFLCDRGRYGYEFVNGEQRIRHIQQMEGAARGTNEPARAMMTMPDNQFAQDAAGIANPKFVNSPARGIMTTPGAVTKEKVLERVRTLVKESRKVIGIGSPRASLESNFALRTLVGPDNFYQGVSERTARLVSQMIDIMQKGPSASPSLREVESCDAVLVLGEDVTNFAPMLALALRQASRSRPVEDVKAGLRIPDWDDKAIRTATQNSRGPFFVATPAATKLEDIATQVYNGAPEDIARLGFAVARGVGAAVPEVTELEKETAALVDTIATALKGARRPLVVSGPGLGSEAVIQAAANVAWALGARLAFTMPEANSLGLGLMGGASLDAAMQDHNVDTVIILENDLYRHAHPTMVDNFLAGKRVIAMDVVVTPTTTKAETVLPAAAFAEADGTLVNYESRAQRFYQTLVPVGQIAQSWEWLRDIGIAVGKAEMLGWRNLDDVMAALTDALPIFKPVLDIAPPADFRVAGQKLAREPERSSGRTAMVAHLSVHEPRPPDDPNTPFNFSMEGFHGQPPPALVNEFRVPGWNSSQQAMTRFQIQVGGPLRGGDPGKRLIEPGQDVRPTYFDKVPTAFERRREEWLAVPLYHIFGSEEMSVLSPGIAEQTPMPYLALNDQDGAELGLEEGHLVALPDGAEPLPVRISGALPAGTVGVPVGLPGMPWIFPSGYVRLSKVAG